MKTDARVRYTKMRIKEAFFARLAEKPVSKITVKELCDMAEINRATFYKHYADPFDLLAQVEEEALDDLRKEIQMYGNDSRQSVLLTILRNISDTSNPYAVLASPNGDPGFTARLSELFYREFQPRFAQDLPGRTEEEQNAAYLFVAGGCGLLLSKWVKSGMRTPAEDVAQTLRTITNTFTLAYGNPANP